MSRRKFKHLTIDDLLPGRSEDTFRIDVDKKGKPRVIRNKKRKKAPLPYFKQFPTFFRLINDNPGIPDPVEEYKFHPTRKWRVDICWPEQKLALEIEGGTYMDKGGHRGSISGYLKDKEKYNALSVQGYWLLRFTPQEMESCESYDILREWFKNNVNQSKTKKT
jgi:very-short-patch-repair endonuclease